MPTATAPGPRPTTRGALGTLDSDHAPRAWARDLTKTYGTGETTVTALDHVDVDIEAGRLTAIMGPSGSGKSTLMHCLAGLDRPTSGTVVVGDHDVTRMRQRALTNLRRTGLGFVFQSFNLIPTLTAEENITLPLDIAREAVDRAWFDEVIDAVGLRDRLGHRPGELSGGQQQRVACARALVTRPSLILADEPTGNLDSRSAGDVLTFLRRSVDELGQTVVMVTHDPRAASYAHRVLFLADGRIADELNDPTPETVLERLGALSPTAGPGAEAAPSSSAAVTA
ncbi:ABC transporter ATP-binding protein [Sanguibacter sp. A247]|uniref:ABC transporter ATP-binding protein n=1 Tax=unclassified Sanguibacter TaxID=2645534 RepID=UPI003FD87574